MKIGIDFDKCYRADPETWREVVNIFQQNGHECVLITKRRPHNEEQVEEVKRVVDGQMPILFAGERYKNEVAEEYGYEIDVWIDDHPEFIHNQSDLKDQLGEAKYKKFLLKRKIGRLEEVLDKIISFLMKYLI